MKMYKIVFPLLASMLVIFITPPAIASTVTQEHKQLVWPFEGAFGTVDRQAAQRGAQVYMEVCSACHGLNHLYYRNLKDLGFSDAEVKEIAAKKDVKDGPNDVGEMFDRPATPSARFALPYPNLAA